MEADLKALQKESDTLTGRVDDPAVQRPLRQTRTRKPFPESLPAMKTAAAGSVMLPGMWRLAKAIWVGCRRTAGADAQRLPGYPDCT